MAWRKREELTARPEGGIGVTRGYEGVGGGDGAIGVAGLNEANRGGGGGIDKGEAGEGEVGVGGGQVAGAGAGGCGKVIELWTAVSGKLAPRNVERLRCLAYSEGAKEVFGGADEDDMGWGGGSYAEE